MSARATAIIPARLGSTRFARKALADATGKALVVHVCERAAAAASVGRVVVACDADEIASVVRAAGFEAVLTSPEHENGTSRLAEAAELLKLRPGHFVVNIQGDEPEIEPETVDAAVLALRAKIVIDTSASRPEDTGSRFQWVGTVASPFGPDEDPSDPNIVKAVTSLLRPDTGVGAALLFSRSLVPHQRDGGIGVRSLKHVGIYAYRVASLRLYMGLDPTPLERTEKLEQLRWLEHGYVIGVAVRNVAHHGIDTPEQYAAFVERWRASHP